MNLTSSCIVFHAPLKSKPVQQSSAMNCKIESRVVPARRTMEKPALSRLSNTSFVSFRFISCIRGCLKIPEKVFLMWRSNFEGDWANYLVHAKRINQMCWLIPVTRCYAQQLFMELQRTLANREKPSEPFSSCCFFLVLISFNSHCLELILTSFSLFSVLASSSCTSCLFTHKEADCLWQPLKCRSQLKMLSAGGCPDGWAGSQKGNLRHPAAVQGQLKDCSHSSSGFTNDANRCVVSP